MNDTSHRDVSAGDLVDAVHVSVELGSVLLAVVAVVGDEQQGVDHLVQQRLDQVTARPQRQQRPAQTDRAQTGGRLVGAHAGAAARTDRQTDIRRPGTPPAMDKLLL